MKMFCMVDYDHKIAKIKNTQKQSDLQHVTYLPFIFSQVLKWYSILGQKNNCLLSGNISIFLSVHTGPSFNTGSENTIQFSKFKGIGFEKNGGF